LSLALIYSRALDGLCAPEVTVEVHLANGLPSFTLVGLADTEVKEARERVRAALQSSSLEFPLNKRITVNLAPADLPKESGRFDLPIALGILAASGQIPQAALQGLEFAGELSLSGEVRPIHGALATALAVKRQSGAGLGGAGPRGGARTLVMPHESAQQACRVPGVEVRACAHLLDAVAALARGEAEALPRARAPAAQAAPLGPDLAEVKGQVQAKRALEIAAAGGHSLLMVGPPGSGKTMLAQRFAGLLPPLAEEEALESAAVLSLAGHFNPARWGQRVTRSPHHSASAVALSGGGSPPRPGEISLATQGILFLDELPEFSRAALEALREPLESGHIVISRAARQARFPARFQLLAAMNPCPCGHLGHPLKACRCTPEAVARYQGRISGPLLDRIDLQVEVPPVQAQDLCSPPDSAERATPQESSAQVAARVAQARQHQLQRQGLPNAGLAGTSLQAHAQLDEGASRFLQAAASRLGWSGRSLHRVMRVARTVADLEQAPQIQTQHLAEAIQFRRALKGASG
jgi:magnesium chelatase family protein